MMENLSRKKRIIFGFFIFISVVIYQFGYQVQDARAIPAFARKYNFPCSVCHLPSFPKLNDFGNIFRDHGYQLGTAEELPTFEGLSKGYWPVSFRTTVGYQLANLKNAGDDGTGKNVNVATGSFGFTGLDILSFGILARDISFAIVLTPDLASAGFFAAPTTGTQDLESAWVKLDNLFHSSYFLNMKVGKYELDLPVSEKRLPTLNTNIVMYHYQAGTPYLSAGMLDPGFPNPNSFAIGENQPGLELFGIKDTPGGGYFRYSLNALSDSNITGPTTGGGRGVNFYGHVTQSFGGYGVVSGQRVGVFGAYGNAPTVDNPGCNGIGGVPAPGGCGPISGAGQPFYRVGVDASLTALNQFNLILAGMRALDSKELFASQGIVGAQDAVWYGGFAELDYNPSQLPTWLFIYRYDLIRNDRPGDPTFAHNFNDVNSHTLMARYYFHISQRTDTTLHLEYNYTQNKLTGTDGGDRIGHTGLAALDFAF